MLEKLIAYLQSLGEEEQKKLMQALQAEESTRQEESTTEQTEEAEQGESTTTEQTQEEQTSEEQEVQDVEEKDTETKEQQENESVEESQQEQQNNTTTEKQSEELATDNPPAFQELLETKIELALIKLGIREDRLEAAKRLFKTEIQSIEDLDKLKELVKEFPEWQKQRKEQGAGFGANLKENGNSLSEEEKKLKAMGIDPKN